MCSMPILAAPVEGQHDAAVRFSVGVQPLGLVQFVAPSHPHRLEIVSGHRVEREVLELPAPDFQASDYPQVVLRRRDRAGPAPACGRGRACSGPPASRPSFWGRAPTCASPPPATASAASRRERRPRSST